MTSSARSSASAPANCCSAAASPSARAWCTWAEGSVFASKAWHYNGIQLAITLAELHHPTPYAATCMACTAVPLCRTHSLQDQAQAMQPAAAHAQQTARLLGKLCALMRQRRGEALLGCSHLSARLVACEHHLGRLPRSAEHAYMSRTNTCLHGGSHTSHMPSAVKCITCADEYFSVHRTHLSPEAG